jgi:hypothetical protein
MSDTVSGSVSIFDGVHLLPEVHPITATFVERLKLDHPAAEVVRVLIDGWVQQECPPGKHAEVAGRLLNENDPTAAEATFFELLTGRILRTLFGNAQWEPEGLPTAGDPDWAVERDGNKEVFETRSLQEDIPEAERRGLALFHALSKLVAPFFVMVHWDQCKGLENAPIRTLTKRVAHALGALQPGTGPHEIVIGHMETRIVLTAGPMAKLRSIIQTKSRTMWSPGVDAIRNAVRKKGHKYAGLSEAGIPYVVVMCTSDPLTDYDSLCTALFGEEAVRVLLPHDGEPIIAAPVLNHNGCLTPTGGGKPPFTRVSAVWLVKCHFDSDHWVVEVTSAPNPWAANPMQWSDPRVAPISHILEPGGAVEFSLPPIQPSFAVT